MNEALNLMMSMIEFKIEEAVIFPLILNLGIRVLNPGRNVESSLLPGVSIREGLVMSVRRNKRPSLDRFAQKTP